MSHFKLLTIGNPKTLKGESMHYATFILHLAPADLSGYEVCPKRTAGCTAACLNTAGRGGMFKRGESTNVIQEARKRKTRLFFHDREAFMKLLVEDIERGINYAWKRDMVPVFRLNGTSDLSWEKYSVVRNGTVFKNVFEAFPGIQFYDYTKVLGRKIANIKNYHLTFSAAESNMVDIEKAMIAGYNIAVVFNTLPEEYLGRQVYNGDKSDLRFLDEKNAIIGLKAKGRAKKDTTGFVRMIELKEVA